MAPTHQQMVYQKDEKVLCFHHELLYEAKVLDSKPSDSNDKKSPLHYRVHYKGWKNTWDDWVPPERLRRFTEENIELAAQLKREMEALRRPTPKLPPHPNKKSGRGSGSTGGDYNSARASEERHSSVQAPSGPRGQKRGRDFEIEKEEAFHTRPSVRIPVPDHLKALLVDDWENVTKNLQLVPLPSKTPVNDILQTYLEEEKTKRTAGSAEYELLEEVIQGLREYFEKCLGRILLYRFEREQFFEIRAQLDIHGKEFAGKTIGDIYGAEHLCRLFVSLPELIAQTNMDPQSVNKLRDEISKLTSWVAKRSNKYLSTPYENASQEYIEKARGV
ncbi:MAG: Esa1p-associated factor [Geoglossum simile]|nr:MAG: Esa1p-associated factor [Geoglossum simile]